jgi:ferrous-iron efflux pump FieF
LMAFIVAAYILIISAKQVKGALLELSDTQLPDDEIRSIRHLVDSFKGRTIEAHDLRTRKSGATRHIDFHLVVCGQLTVEASHTVCDDLENKIMEVFPRCSVNIHVEPCEREKTGCQKTCQVVLAKV